MNPIIVIGLVSVVTAGLYGTYDGLEKQAELASLHADMLSRQHAANSVFVNGETADGGQNIIILNDGPQSAELVQVRAYAGGGGAPVLLGTWEMSYELAPLSTFNLTDATPPPPADLRGAVLKTSVDAGETYRGVTSSGSIFEIEHVIPPLTPPPGTFGHMSAMPLTGGGGSTSHTGGLSVTSYYYATSPVDCDQLYVIPGTSYTRYLEFVSIYGSPYSTTTGGPGTPTPAGSPAWYELTSTGSTGSDRPHVPACSTFTTGLSTVPSYLTPYPGYSNVYHEVLWTSGTSYNLNLPLSGGFDVASDGNIILHVEVPVTVTARAAYDGNTLVQFNQNIGHCDNFNNLRGPSHLYSPHLDRWGSPPGAPSLTASMRVEKNGANAGSMGMSGTSSGLDGETSISNRNFAFDSYVVPGFHNNCYWRLTADADSDWSHNGVLVGQLTTSATAGDRIDFTGTVRLNYAPPTVADATVDTTYGSLELGDAIVTVGTAP